MSTEAVLYDPFKEYVNHRLDRRSTSTFVLRSINLLSNIFDTTFATLFPSTIQPILLDDRYIIRRTNNGFDVQGRFCKVRVTCTYLYVLGKPGTQSVLFFTLVPLSRCSGFIFSWFNETIDTRSRKRFHRCPRECNVARCILRTLLTPRTEREFDRSSSSMLPVPVCTLSQ